MTRKVEVQAISWPSSWLPERQITPAFTLLRRSRGPARSAAGAFSAVAAGLLRGRVHLRRASSAKGLSPR